MLITMRNMMDFDDSCYFVDLIDECVKDFVQGSLLKDTLNEILEEEPQGEVSSKSDKPKNKVDLTPRKKWWKRVETKKKKLSTSPRKNTLCTPSINLGEFVLISMLKPYMVDNPPIMRGMKGSSCLSIFDGHTSTSS